ncbi:hypothetical protein X747_17890 [Mesorhizobium sp. LNJC384A00]|nr:hypothetical protein X765_10415 [Mesorhizobium sp. LSHC440B00]ESX37720.1 hypothetical protein X763_10200 [Mesorhizobium sp. LSHC432A00]ESY40968.1 hypothetical protein X747_17890 [Mesorhizobium sp. LNJC384A00]
MSDWTRRERFTGGLDPMNRLSVEAFPLQRFGLPFGHMDARIVNHYI